MAALTLVSVARLEARTRHRRRHRAKAAVSEPSAAAEGPTQAEADEAAAPATPVPKPSGPALSAAEITKRVSAALAVAAKVKPDPLDPLPALQAKFLSSIIRLGTPFPVSEGRSVRKFLVPAFARPGKGTEERVCGLIHVEPTTGTVLAWPPMKPGPAPATLWTSAQTLAILTAYGRKTPPPLATEPDYRPLDCGPDPTKIPGAYLVRGWDDATVKNQDPTAARVAELNASGRYRSALHYDHAQLDPPLESVAAAASSCVDWWRSRQGMPALTHTAWLSGILEGGLDPRELEVAYRASGAPLMPGALLKDPVTGEAPTLGLEGFCKVLTSGSGSKLREPLERPDVADPSTFEISQPANAMEGQYQEVLQHEKRDEATPETLAAKVDKALRAHGVLLARTGSVTRLHRSYALHGMAIIGDAVVGGKPCVLYGEIYGDRGLDFPGAGNAAPSYKALPVERIYSAYAFPHHIALSLGHRGTGGQFELEATSSSGRPVDLDGLDVRLVGMIAAGVSLGGRTATGLSATRIDRGVYRIVVPKASLRDPSSRLIVAADCEHFREPGGQPCSQSFLLAQVPSL